MASKDPTYRRLITSAKWTTLRNWYLQQHPTCERCQKEYGIYTPAECVHHIQPVEDARSMTEQAALMFNPDNLMALCRQCHHDIHNQLGYHTNQQVQERRKESADRAMAAFFGTD